MALAPNFVFGRYLKKMRLERNVPLEDVAKRTGLPTLFIQAVEEGRKAIPAGILLSYPVSIGVPLTVLMREFLQSELIMLCHELDLPEDKWKLTLEKIQ